MELSSVSPGDEHFWPTLTQYADGSIHIVANDDSCTLVHLRGRRDGGASFALPIFDERATLGMPYSLNRVHTILTNREESLALNARVIG